MGQARCWKSPEKEGTSGIGSYFTEETGVIEERWRVWGRCGGVVVPAEGPGHTTGVVAETHFAGLSPRRGRSSKGGWVSSEVEFKSLTLSRTRKVGLGAIKQQGLLLPLPA